MATIVIGGRDPPRWRSSLAMALTFSFQFSPLFNETVADQFGNWQYAAGNLHEPTLGFDAQLIATKRTNAFGNDSFPCSMLTATVIFPSAGSGAPPNLTLQGVKAFDGGAESGSVSAASFELSAQIGGPFTFDGTLLIIQAPGVQPAAETSLGEGAAALIR